MTTPCTLAERASGCSDGPGKAAVTPEALSLWMRVASRPLREHRGVSEARKSGACVYKAGARWYRVGKPDRSYQKG